MPLRSIIPAILMSCVMTVLAGGDGRAASGSVRDMLASRLCAGLAGKMDGSPAPFVFRSFEPAPDGKALDPALSNTGFTYDNALASIALFACGKDAEATRVADALLLAVNRDRRYSDGRLRNAYRSGPVVSKTEVMLLPGFWNAASNAWVEDGYQVGSATGNLAWAALALLTASERSDNPAYLQAAEKIMRWIDAYTKGESDIGYTGGTFGHEPSPVKLDWKSTEHNLDVYAVASWLTESGDDKTWRTMQDRAGKFLDAMWNEQQGHFYVGSLPGSDRPNLTQSGIDSELWPILVVPEFRGRAERVLEWVDRHYAVGEGFDFNDDRDGIWLEGTAQAALAFQHAGHAGRAEALLATIDAEVSPDGLVYATVGPELTTGLMIGPASTSADFKYFRLPHVGATAWAILAAKDWNPFLRESSCTRPCRNYTRPGRG
ncbi:hypothetical protein EN837_00510 [bacterium M00.F.Ca.ET.194.01.1.1]|uniref:hypothetical protein n=1 Tax=Agrobacterium pusense TaxID=648995 RepID=UPI001091FB1B|nr:hypothetical protein [Agrobacterium pusense]MBW9061048.1 hypothetical protein [Agrobacterium pusense]TGR71878.1 hypothetical protein EN837_00510 [bacterium M00.F.Ca.ET.194.01.1.1]TGS56780.1 hypothetical protein EN822_00510 [bacterium M00.F.Ca.ET.179.01.1.1]TGV49711.1 hypothetical protein EN811_00510 [bacterium M00.F.Ca.ET.168.01.1.1]